MVIGADRLKLWFRDKRLAQWVTEVGSVAAKDRKAAAGQIRPLPARYLSLSASAADSLSASQWMEPAQLVRLSTIPFEAVIRHAYDVAQYALEGAVLRPLEAFGVFERREDPVPGQRFGTPELLPEDCLV